MSSRYGLGRMHFIRMMSDAIAAPGISTDDAGTDTGTCGAAVPARRPRDRTGSGQGTRTLRQHYLVDPGGLAADQRTDHRPGTPGIYLGRHPEWIGAFRRRALHHLHARQRTGVARHLHPHVAEGPRWTHVDRHLQGTGGV